ncbi:MAG TPA: hypothetical protein VGQ83_07410 [Polyangia bacterium]|jgi:hypothetical protein
MNRLLLCAALCAAVSIGALACETNKGGSTIHETEATPLPPIKVDLPPPPAFNAPTTPEKYPDGLYSVFGLRKGIEKLTGQQVTVKAFVREVYQCPECPKGQECKACEQPHYWLTDEKEGKKEKAIMVVDYPTKKPLVETPPVFTVGAKVTVKGTLQRATLSGFNASDGLLTHLETKDEAGQMISEGNTNVAFDTKGTAAGKGDKMRARVEGTDGKKILTGGPKGALPKKRTK